MNISAMKAYSNPLVQSSDYQDENQKLQSKKVFKPNTQKLAEDKSKLDLSKNSLDVNNNVLTKKERDFFVKLFPDNSDQLERHVLFTKNGKVQASNTRLGTIVDGRI